jgi:hypothetical protein
MLLLLLPTRSRVTKNFNIFIFIYYLRDLVGNFNNSITNCIFYLTKKSNQTEDGS